MEEEISGDRDQIQRALRARIISWQGTHAYMEDGVPWWEKSESSGLSELVRSPSHALGNIEVKGGRWEGSHLIARERMLGSMMGF
jgi:hypothetical protein